MRKSRFLAFIILIAVSFSVLCSSAFATGYDPAVPTITKNPTSEALNVGGKTWFIAHAENANSLTWLMVDPLGNLFTLENTAAILPGLSLEALEGDTLAVSNVPAELNGWGVVARFDNSAGYQMTEPAYIYVGDFLTAYSRVIESYREGKQMADSTGLDAAMYGICEYANWYQSVGYALKDLDKNGIPELIIAGIGPESVTLPHPVFEIYTLENNNPTQICMSWPRCRYYLLRDNSILLEGSSGAAYSILEIYQNNGAQLQFIEGFRTDEDIENQKVFLYYSTSYKAFYNEQTYIDTNSPAVSVISIQDTFDDYFRYQEAYFAQTWIPYLTKIV